MKHKLYAICPVCSGEASLDGRRIKRHASSVRGSSWSRRSLWRVCIGTNYIATDDAVRAWLTRESERADQFEASAKNQREHADRLRVAADEADAEVAALRAFVAAQLAKLGGAS